MNTLSALLEREPVELPEFALDRFQRQVLEHLHLEFFFSRCRVLIAPHLGFFATGEFDPEEEARITAILAEKSDAIHQLKQALLYDLSHYSALLETGSYEIAANGHVVIARFLRFADPSGYEVKLYTVAPGDVLGHYADKLYLGRDFITLDSPRRAQLGLGYLRVALPLQIEKLRGRLGRDVPARALAELQREFVDDVAGLIGEFAERAGALIGSLPAEISSQTLDRDGLLTVNGDIRELKHLLVESEGQLRELEGRLLASDSHAARYVTKLRHDVTNTINYFMLKVNGRISDAVNGIRL